MLLLLTAIGLSIALTTEYILASHVFTFQGFVCDRHLIIIIIIIIIITAIGLSPGGSGYFAWIQNMKLFTNKFKSGELHEKHVVATWNLPSMFKTGVHLPHFPIIILSKFVSHILHMCKSHPRLPLLPVCHILCELIAEAEEAAEHQTHTAIRHN